MLLISFVSSWFIQGLLHPLQTPAHILLTLGLGLLIGQQRNVSINLPLFSIAVFIGLFLNYMTNININYELNLLILVLIIVLLVIVKLSLPSLVVWFAVIVSGIVLGLDSSPVLIPGLGSKSVYNWLAGAGVSFVGIIFLASFVAFILNKLWHGIVLRVLASWIATSTIFVITFILLGVGR